MADPSPNYSLSRLSADELIALTDAYRRSAAERAGQVSDIIRQSRLSRKQVRRNAWRARAGRWRRRLTRGPLVIARRTRALFGRAARRMLGVLRPTPVATCPHCGGRLS